MHDTPSIIKQKLTEALNPTHLEIIDESALHVGHAGAQNGAGHYHISISSPSFQGYNMVHNHRLIYQALDGLIPSAIHALKIKIVPTS